MFSFPFKDRAVAERYAEGLLKAGLVRPISGIFPGVQGKPVDRGRNQGPALRFDNHRNTFLATGQYSIDFKKNGEFTWRGANSSDSGKSRIEGDMICTQYQKNWWGLEDCATVFRNPSGTPENKDEYFFASDSIFRTFSPVR